MSMKSVKKIPAAKLYVSEPSPSMFGNDRNPSDWKGAGWTCANWLRSRFHFEFAEYRNRAAREFGVLRVVNDDLVQGKRGFGAHPHHNMEIVTYVVSGELTHKDSMGSAETLGSGSVQFMTAGSGVVHSEYNSGNAPVRFIQSWITPSKYGLKPHYGSYRAPATRPTGWFHIASSVETSSNTPIKLNQDVDMFSLKHETPSTYTFSIASGRQGYLLCIGGPVVLNGGVGLENHDAAELQGPLEVTTKADSTELILFTMKGGSSGRSDL